VDDDNFRAELPRLFNQLSDQLRRHVRYLAPRQYLQIAVMSAHGSAELHRARHHEVQERMVAMVGDGKAAVSLNLATARKFRKAKLPVTHRRVRVKVEHKSPFQRMKERL
jgi:hypothetical protein